MNDQSSSCIEDHLSLTMASAASKPEASLKTPQPRSEPAHTVADAYVGEPRNEVHCLGLVVKLLIKMLRDPAAHTRPGLKLLPDLVSYPGPVYNVRTVPGRGMPSHGFSKADRFSSTYSEAISSQFINAGSNRETPQVTADNKDGNRRKLSLPPFESLRSSTSLGKEDSPSSSNYRHTSPSGSRTATFGLRSSLLNKGDYPLESSPLPTRGATRSPLKFLKTETPGPSTYNPKLLDLSSRITFPKSNRELTKPPSRSSTPLAQTSAQSPLSAPQELVKPLQEIRELRPIRPMKRVALTPTTPKANFLEERERKLQQLVKDFERRKTRNQKV